MTHQLAGDYDRIKEVCARHGVEISATRVRRVLERFAPEEQRSHGGWRRIFEQTTAALLRQSGGP